MRLNAYLARAGIASRRGADDLIKAGRVLVNGEPGQLNTFVESRDKVTVDGAPVSLQRLTYLLLHKPAGVVTTARDPQGRPTVVELVPEEPRVVPVGRLDADTTGALLLTNDGPLAHRLAHPRYEIEKVYEAEIGGRPGEDILRSLARGRRARRRHHRAGEGAACRPAHDRADRSTRDATVRSSACSRRWAHPVRRLHRSVYAGLSSAEGSSRGQWRELEPSEVMRLRSG